MAYPLFQLVCLSFGLFAVAYFAFNDAFAVWARTPQSLGGLGLSSGTIGSIQGTGGLGTLIASLLFYPRLAAWLGLPNMFRLGLAMNLSVFCWPAVITGLGWRGAVSTSSTTTSAANANVNATGSGGSSNGLFWLLTAVNGLNTMGAEFCFTTGNLLLKEAVPRRFVGAALGLGNTAVNVGAALGPILGASLYAFSLSLHGHVFGRGKLCFVVLELLVAANLVCSTAFPRWPWDGDSSKSCPKPNQVVADASGEETQPLFGGEVEGMRVSDS
jgi:hypothetical protein